MGHVLHCVYAVVQQHMLCSCVVHAHIWVHVALHSAITSTCANMHHQAKSHNVWSWLQYEGRSMSLVADLLAQLPKVTGLVVLQHTLIQAALHFLGSTAATPSRVSLGVKPAVQQVRSGALALILVPVPVLVHVPGLVLLQAFDN